MPFVGIGVTIGGQLLTSEQYLLDTYSGAAAAYSLRLVSSTYSGDAIRVRRASDNAETNIGFVSGQLDTTTLETFCSGTDGFVTTWYDQSGNGNDVSQPTAANQPQIVNSGSTITENGKYNINFNTPYFLYNSTSEVITTGYSQVTMFGVSRSDTRSNSTLYALEGAYPDAGLGIRPSPDSTLRFNDGFFSWGISYPTNQILRTTIKNNLNYKEWSNSVSVLNQSRSSENDREGYINISGGSVNKDIQELIIYPSDQSSNRTGIETNINDFYNIY